MKRQFFLLLFAALLAGCQTAPNKNCCKNSCATIHRAPVKTGLDVLFEKYPDLLHGKRVGLITNPAGVDSHLDSDVEIFRAHGVNLVALYGPEHGVRGNSQAGQTVPFYFDEHLQLPVFSLYGPTEKPPAEMLTNIDEYMRSYDTRSPAAVVEQTSGSLTNGQNTFRGVDVMVYDLQDAGTRVYTFIATMAYAMQACANAGIPFVVLDRPNPIGGVAMEGPILQYPKYSSFIGLYPIPLRHGMTMGELAKLFNEKFFPAYGHKKANLTVVPMENWTRDGWFDETGLPWVLPSPNLPTLDSTTVYPGQVLLEGTDLSEGRGTTKPFEFFGAPWIDGFNLAKKLNELNLPGVKFREVWFTPTFSKFQGKLCGGCQIHVTDRNKYNSLTTTLAELQTIKQLYGDKLEFHASYFDKVLGTSEVREALERGESFQKIVAGFQPGLDDFAKLRAPFLLYR